MKKIFTKPTAIALSVLMVLGAAAGAVYALQKTPDVKAENTSAKVQKTEQSETAVTKDESVYVIAGADGSVQKIIVSDWIKNNLKSDKIVDTAAIADAENVKGKESYVMNGDNMRVWDAKGNDIYCKGNVEKELPVNLGVTYTLDGKTVSPEEIKGKSGKVTIRYDYKNNQYETVTINGNPERIYVPFLMLTGAVLDNDVFSDIEVTNGRMINDGNRSFAVGIALPGLADNLNVNKNDINIPEYVEIKATVKNFKMSNTVTIATNELFSKIDTAASDDITAVGKSIESGVQQLTSGSSALYGGLCTLLQKSGTLVSGINKMSDGAAALKAGGGDLKGGVTELLEGLTELTDKNEELKGGASQIYDSVLKTVHDTVAGYGITLPELTKENYKTVLENVIKDPDDTQKKELIGIANAELDKKLTAANIDSAYHNAVKYMLYERAAMGQDAAMAEISEILTHAKLYATDPTKYASFAPDALKLQTAMATAETAAGKAAINGLCLTLAKQSMKTGIDSAIEKLDGVNEFYNGLCEYTAGVLKAKVGTVDLQEGAQKLYDGISELQSGIIEMKNGTPALVNGITELKDGAGKLSDGIKEFRAKSIDKLSKATGGDISLFATRLRATVEVSKNYKSFTGLADNTDGKVKFIYRTDAIE